MEIVAQTDVKAMETEVVPRTDVTVTETEVVLRKKILAKIAVEAEPRAVVMAMMVKIAVQMVVNELRMAEHEMEP